EALLGVEAAVEDVFGDAVGERGDRGREVVAPLGADRAGRTGDEGHLGVAHLGRARRLAVHARLVARLVERLRRDPAAGVAVDAGRVDEEVAGDVRGETACERGHGRTLAEPRATVARPRTRGAELVARGAPTPRSAAPGPRRRSRHVA